MADLYKFLCDDVKGSGPGLEDIMAFAERAKEWSVVLSPEEDMIIGYTSRSIQRDEPFSFFDYAIEVTRKDEEYTVAFKDDKGILAQLPNAQEIFELARMKFDRQLSLQYKKRFANVKTELERLKRGGFTIQEDSQ